MITEKTKQEIWHLYFDRLYSYSKLIEHFNNKYTYAEIKKTIQEKYKGR